jgi:ubiquitin-like 1-activating enzyme E1 B
MFALADEIEKLRQEAQALMRIRESMGSDNFPQLLFDKVYKDDIIRLRSMEEMWKTRRRPEPLDYATIFAKTQEPTMASRDEILRADQRAWTLEENVVIFIDRQVIST